MNTSNNNTLSVLERAMPGELNTMQEQEVTQIFLIRFRQTIDDIVKDLTTWRKTWFFTQEERIANKALEMLKAKQPQTNLYKEEGANGFWRIAAR